MVSDRAKNPGGPTTDKAKRSSPLESIPHRPRKRSLSTMLTAKDEFVQVSREQVEATRLLTKTPLLSKPAPSSRHSDSARLLKLVPDLTQKEVSRLVAALMKRQKRDSASTGKKRGKSLTRTVPALFQEKDMHQKLSSQEATHGQRGKVHTPARITAGSKTDALRMLREAEPHPDPSRSSAGMTATTTGGMSYRQDLAEELVHRASPR